MKLIGKIAVVAGLIVFVSSCQKEDLPVLPGGTSVQDGSTDRRSGTDGNGGASVMRNGGEQNSGNGEIVGGGDDDRDGGSKRMGNSTGIARDSASTQIQTGESSGTDEIVGGGDDDRDGGGDGKKKGSKGG